VRFSLRLRRWAYPLISATLAISLILVQPMTAQAISWADIILQGIQVVQLSSMSTKQEMALGAQINEEILSGQARLYDNPALTAYINQIGQRLASNSSRNKITYTFQVVDDDSINAFATMGGYVYVHTGLIKTADNEAELAGVMAHEIGHIAAKHSIKQMKDLAIAKGIVGGAGLKKSVAVNLGVELAMRRPNSRTAEHEADKLGMEAMGRAGYGQSGMVSFMKKLGQKASMPTFLSTHPSSSDRVQRLEKLVTKSTGDGLDGPAYKAKTKI
jgi:beta-barrel assembly-enhancing protease